MVQTCPSCNADIRDGAAFCSECGAKIVTPIAEEAPAAAAAQPSYAPTPPDSAPPAAVAAPPYQAPAPAPARRAARIPFLGWLAFAGMVTAIFLPCLPGLEGYMNWIGMVRSGWQSNAVPWVAYVPFIIPAWSLMGCLVPGWPGAVARVLGGFAALGLCVYVIAISSGETGFELLRVLGAGFWVLLGAGLVMLISGSYEGK